MIPARDEAPEIQGMKNGSGLGAGSRSLLLGTKALENPPSGENREDREREEEHSAAAVEPERKCGALQLLRRSAAAQAMAEKTTKVARMTVRPCTTI